jgi:putative MATE family efflux protein
MGVLGADAPTIAAGTTFLHWFIPGLALQFALVVMGSALRGTGIVKPTMVVQMLTVLLNAALAPVLIAGWGTGKPMGVAGAALASTLSVAVGVLVMSIYFVRLEKYVGFDAAQWRPKVATWKKLLDIGLPAGGEFFVIAVFTGVVYWIVRDFGAAAQAGFGIGSRIMQMIFLPAMAVAFAAAPIAGQNYGAKLFERVRKTFASATAASCAIMAIATIVAKWKGASMIAFFTQEPEVIAVAAQFLDMISWNFVAMGVVFTCSSLFQALGNTWPALASTTMRLVIFAVPAIWMSRQPGFQLVHVWYLSVATVLVQAVTSYALLQREFRRRLNASQPLVGDEAVMRASP